MWLMRRRDTPLPAPVMTTTSPLAEKRSEGLTGREKSMMVVCLNDNDRETGQEQLTKRVSSVMDCNLQEDRKCEVE